MSEVYGDARFIRLASISNGHIYNLRKSRIYRTGRRASHKAVGPGGVGCGQHLLPVLDHLGGAAEVDLLGGEQVDAAVPVSEGSVRTWGAPRT